MAQVRYLVRDNGRVSWPREQADKNSVGPRAENLARCLLKNHPADKD